MNSTNGFMKAKKLNSTTYTSGIASKRSTSTLDFRKNKKNNPNDSYEDLPDPIKKLQNAVYSKNPDNSDNLKDKAVCFI